MVARVYVAASQSDIPASEEMEEAKGDRKGTPMTPKFLAGKSYLYSSV